MLLAPLAQLTQYRGQVPAGIGEQVIVAGRVVTVGSALHQPDVFELTQPGDQTGPWSAGILADVVEPGYTQAYFAQRKQRPPVADQLQRVGDRTHSRAVLTECRS